MKKKNTEERIEFDPEAFSFRRIIEEAHQMEKEYNINLEISKSTIEQFDKNINIRKFYMFLIKQDMKLNLSKKLQKIFGDAYQENSLNDYELKKANNIKTNSTLDVKALKDLVCIIYLIYKQQHNHKKTTKEKIKTIKRILNMFYKDNDYYKLIFWKRIDNCYIIWRYNTNPKEHLSFYCIIPCEFLWGIHSVYKLKLYYNRLHKDFIISIINSEDISILESSKNYKVKLDTIKKILADEYSILKKSCDCHRAEVPSNKKHKFCCRMCKRLEQKISNDKNVKNFRMDKLKKICDIKQRREYFLDKISVMTCNITEKTKLYNLACALFDSNVSL